MPEDEIFDTQFGFSGKAEIMDKFWQCSFGSVGAMTVPADAVSLKHLQLLLDPWLYSDYGKVSEWKLESAFERWKMGTDA